MKVKNARSLIITSRKWYLTSDDHYAYTYLESSIVNRKLKDQIIEQLTKREIATKVFFKDLLLRGRIDRISTYIIASPKLEFTEIFTNVDLKSSNLNFDKVEENT